MPDEALIILWISLIVLLLAIPALAALRTSRLRTKKPEPVKKPDFNPEHAKRAAESLSHAITFETVISDTTPEWGEWVRLREYLKARYPLFHERLSREQVAGHSLLYHWPTARGGKKTGGGNDAERLPLLFCAHLDVVPASGEWKYPPFSGTVAEGYVWGRGALDCKHILICLMEAVEDLLKGGFTPSRDIYFAFGHDEEPGGADGATSIARLFMQRGLRFAMVLDEGGALSRGIIPVGRPVAEVCVAEKGMVNFRMTARGASGHASVPPRHTVLGRMSEAVARVEFRRRKARLTPVISDGLHAIAPYMPYKYRMYLANLWLFRRSLFKALSKEPKSNAMIRSTIAPTMSSSGTAPNVLPNHAEAVLNTRLLHGEDEKMILAYLQDLTADLDVSVEAIMHGSASAVADYKGPEFAALAEVIRDRFGDVPVAPSLFTGGTDARYYVPFCDTVLRFMPFILTPDDHASIHSGNERVLIDSLGVAVGFYQDLIQKLG